MSEQLSTEAESSTADLIIFAAANNQGGGQYFDDNVESGHCWLAYTPDWQEKAGDWSNGGVTARGYHDRATMRCIIEALAHVPTGMSVHVCGDIDYILAHLNASWPDRARADYLNSKGKPFKHREELRQMGGIIISRQLTVTAGRPQTERGTSVLLRVKEKADLATRNIGRSFSDWEKR